MMGLAFNLAMIVTCYAKLAVYSDDVRANSSVGDPIIDATRSAVVRFASKFEEYAKENGASSDVLLKAYREEASDFYRRKGVFGVDAQETLGEEATVCVHMYLMTTGKMG